MAMDEIRIRLNDAKQRMRMPFLSGVVLATGFVVVMGLLVMSMFDWPALG